MSGNSKNNIFKYNLHNKWYSFDLNKLTNITPEEFLKLPRNQQLKLISSFSKSSNNGTYYLKTGKAEKNTFWRKQDYNKKKNKILLDIALGSNLTKEEKQHIQNKINEIRNKEQDISNNINAKDEEIKAINKELEPLKEEERRIIENLNNVIKNKDLEESTKKRLNSLKNNFYKIYISTYFDYGITPLEYYNLLDNLQDEINKIELDYGTNKELQKNIDDANQNIADIKDELTNKQNEIQPKLDSIEQKNKEIEQLNIEIKDCENEINVILQNMEPLTDERKKEILTKKIKDLQQLDIDYADVVNIGNVDKMEINTISDLNLKNIKEIKGLEEMIKQGFDKTKEVNLNLEKLYYALKVLFGSDKIKELLNNKPESVNNFYDIMRTIFKSDYREYETVLSNTPFILYCQQNNIKFDVEDYIKITYAEFNYLSLEKLKKEMKNTPNIDEKILFTSDNKTKNFKPYVEIETKKHKNHFVDDEDKKINFDYYETEIINNNVEDDVNNLIKVNNNLNSNKVIKYVYFLNKSTIEKIYNDYEISKIKKEQNLSKSIFEDDFNKYFQTGLNTKTTKGGEQYTFYSSPDKGEGLFTKKLNLKDFDKFKSYVENRFEELEQQIKNSQHSTPTHLEISQPKHNYFEIPRLKHVEPTEQQPKIYQDDLTKSLSETLEKRRKDIEPDQESEDSEEWADGLESSNVVGGLLKELKEDLNKYGIALNLSRDGNSYFINVFERKKAKPKEQGKGIEEAKEIFNKCSGTSKPLTYTDLKRFYNEEY